MWYISEGGRNGSSYATKAFNINEIDLLALTEYSLKAGTSVLIAILVFWVK